VTAIAVELTKRAVDEKAIIALGWGAFQRTLVPHTPPDVKNTLMLAFYCGALHLFSSLNVFLDPGDEPTDRDMQRMCNIADEVLDFEKLLERTIEDAKRQGK